MKKLALTMLVGLGLLAWGLFGPALDREAQSQETQSQGAQTQEASLPEEQSMIRFEAVAVEDGALGRLQALGGAVGFSEWSRPAERYVAPGVSRSLLSEPTRVNEGVRACTTVRFGDEPWGRCDWSWRGVPNEQESAEKGRLGLEVTLAPDARAAQEHLLAAFGDNMLPIEALVTMAEAAERPEGLGTTALLTRSRDGSDVSLRFSRANVAFHIRGQGSLAGEVLPLARRLDAKVLSQQPLTYEQLVGRRPGITLNGGAEAGALGFELQVPTDLRVLNVEARVDGDAAPAANGRVVLAGRKGTVQVEVLTITHELLVGAARTELSLAE